MGATTTPVAKPADDGFLRGFWYPAARSAEIRGRAVRPVMLLNFPLVVGRNTQGQAFALRDACPHRGYPFSECHFDGQLVECAYHGWKFDPVSGQCREIPSLMPDSKLNPEKIYAKAFPAEEHDGYVWVYMPDPDAPGDPPPAPRLPVFSEHYKLEHLYADLPCHVDHGVIGLMDPAHGPFVHQAWWWRTRRSIRAKEKTFEPIPNGFRMRAHTPSANSAPYKLLGVYGKPITTRIDFVLPNMRFEEIHCGDYWFSSRTTVTPVTSTHCRIDVCAAWNIFRHVPFLVPILRFFGNRFVDQDTQTMIKQARGLKYNPPLMLIDDADRPAKWYFALKAAYQESRRTGQPMKHPIAEATTLRWRS